MSKRNNDIDFGLKIWAEVLKLEHLHWGYFPEKKIVGEPVAIAELKKAQLDYTQHLFSFIPPQVKTILDVGAGLGKTASLLTEKGYQVHCLSNDEYQRTVINERYPGIPFTKSKFEENQLGKKFDLVLMSESVQYLDWPRALTKLEEVLNPNGYLLLADYFRKNDDLYYKACKLKEPFQEATALKFTLLNEEDITDYVLPTLDFGTFYWNKYILPVAGIVEEIIAKKTKPFLKFLINLALGKKIMKMRHYIWEHSPDKFNRDKFKNKLDYLIQLWQKK
jgi:2-polyprenyl-3-methyl-5-hydroxy-6-metoxy-1,4-benzoquinol methylase